MPLNYSWDILSFQCTNLSALLHPTVPLHRSTYLVYAVLSKKIRVDVA